MRGGEGFRRNFVKNCGACVRMTKICCSILQGHLRSVGSGARPVKEDIAAGIEIP